MNHWMLFTKSNISFGYFVNMLSVADGGQYAHIKIHFRLFSITQNAKTEVLRAQILSTSVLTPYNRIEHRKDTSYPWWTSWRVTKN